MDTSNNNNNNNENIHNNNDNDNNNIGNNFNGIHEENNENMPLYFDYNATTPLLREVADAMMPYMIGLCGNPSSGHVYGKYAKEAVRKARQQVSNLINCEVIVYF